MRKINNKKVWLTAGLAASFAFLGAGLATVDTVDTSANNTVTAESVGLVMDKGASVRLGTTDGNNGIRFALTMDKTEYDSLMEKVGTEENDEYLDISFGMIITKASYVSNEKDLTVENLFDLDSTDGVDNTKFQWKPENADENWTVATGKSLVVNQTFGYLGTAKDYENDYVGFASLVEIQDYNLTQEFIGRGYMKYTAKDGTVNYRMADYFENSRENNVRSMTYVAQKAIEDPDMSAYVGTLNSLYVTHSAVASQDVSVTVKHHKIDVHGEETVETETLTGCKIGGTATATALTEEGWIYDETKSTASGVVYANGKTVLDLYYDQDPETTYDLWFDGAATHRNDSFALETPVTGAVRYDTLEVVLDIDVVEGSLNGSETDIYFKLINNSNNNVVEQWNQIEGCLVEGTTSEYKFELPCKWATIGGWDIYTVFIQLKYKVQCGINVKSITVKPTEYDFRVNKQTEFTYNLPEAVTGAIKGDKAIVTLEMINLVGSLTSVKMDLRNKSNGIIANHDNIAYTLADCATGEANTYAFTINIPWLTGDWDITAIRLWGVSASCVVGVNVKSVEIVSDYDLKYTTNSVTHQAKTIVFDTPTITGKHYNEYIKISFDMPVVYGTVNSIQFITYCDVAATEARTNNQRTVYKADGTALAATTDSAKYVLMSNFNLSQSNRVEMVVKFPWNNDDHTVRALLLAFRGASGFKVAVDNVKVELMPNFTPAA